MDVRFELIDGLPGLDSEVAGIEWGPDAILSEQDSHHIRHGTAAGGGYWQLVFRSDTLGQEIAFVVASGGDQVWAFRHDRNSRHDQISIQDVTTLLIGSVMGLVLRLRGNICLHATVVSIAGDAIILLGKKGAGKSSLAAALASRGHEILSDDMASMTCESGSFVVHPGYPRIRLWPESLEALEQTESHQVPVLSVLNKRYLELGTEIDNASLRFGHAQLRVAGIYVLGQRGEVESPIIAPLTRPHGLKALIEHTSVGFLRLERARREQEFARLGRIAATVPVFALQRPDGWTHISAVCSTLEKSVATVYSPS